MYSEIAKIGPFTVNGYGLMIGIGVLCAVLIADIRAKKRNLNDNLVFNLALIAVVFGFIGAKLLYILVEFESFIKNPMYYISGSGFVVYGGIVVGVLSAIIYCRMKKVNFLDYFDILAPSISIAQGFGRLGCLLAGCCYGRETESFIGIIFRHSPIAPNNISLFPTQIISSAGNFAIAIALILYAKKARRPGKVGALYLILYSVGRFFVEFYRDDFRGSIWFMSTSQFISIFVLIGAILLFFMKRSPFKKKEDESVTSILDESIIVDINEDNKIVDDDTNASETKEEIVDKDTGNIVDEEVLESEIVKENEDTKIADSKAEGNDIDENNL